MDSRTQLAWDWVGARVCDPGESQAGVICPRECRPWHHLPTEQHTDAPGHLLGQRTTLKHRRECGCAWDSGSTQRGCSAPALLPPGARLLAGRQSSILASPRQRPSPGVTTTKTACSRAWVSWLTVALLKGHCCLVSSSYFPGTASTPHPVPRSHGCSRYLHSELSTLPTAGQTQGQPIRVPSRELWLQDRGCGLVWWRGQLGAGTKAHPEGAGATESVSLPGNPEGAHKAPYARSQRHSGLNPRPAKGGD